MSRADKLVCYVYCIAIKENLLYFVTLLQAFGGKVVGIGLGLVLGRAAK